MHDLLTPEVSSPLSARLLHPGDPGTAREPFAIAFDAGVPIANENDTHASADASTPASARPAVVVLGTSWLLDVALAFVVLSLVLLAVSPTIVNRRMEAERREIEGTLVPAERLVRELDLTYERIGNAHKSYRLGEPSARERYQAQKLEERRLIDSLIPLARRIGPQVAVPAQLLRSLLERLGTLTDPRVNGGDDDQQFVARTPMMGSIDDSMTVVRSELRVAIDSARRRQLDRGDALTDRERLLSLGLGVLALASVVVVGWLARRERTLSAALQRAISVETRLREEAEQRREELLRIGESKSRLMRGFSHDVKNPIGAADGFLQLLEDGVLGPLNEKQQLTVSRVRRSIGAALALIHDLLQMAKAETGRIDVVLEPTDVIEVTRDAAEEYRAQAAAKGLALSLELPDEMPMLITDRTRLRQILGNLVSNAVKYTAGGTVTLRAREQAGEDGARRLLIEVSDTGAGIAPHRVRLLFQEFVRLDPTASPGVGIGLAISQRIARVLGGDIAVRSEVGKGTTFTLMIPIVLAAAPAAEAAIA